MGQSRMQISASIGFNFGANQQPVAKIFAGEVLVGYKTLSDLKVGGTELIYEPLAGYFLHLRVSTGGGVTTLSLAPKEIEYETFDCTGPGLVILVSSQSDTRNELIINSGNYYKTVGAHVSEPLYTNSVLDRTTGICRVEAIERNNAGISMIEPVAYPLPYELPISLPAYSLRMEYDSP